MRIAIIGSRGYPYVYSGYETFVSETSERLVRMGVEVTVYCHRGLFTKRPSKVNGVDLIYLPSIETKILSQLSHSFLSMMHACLSDADVLLVVNPANGPFGIISRVFRKKTMINMDGLEWLRPKWKGFGAKYFYWASKTATKLYDLVINDSQAMRDIYLRQFNSDSEVIAYGANIRFSKEPHLIDEWDLKSSSYYLLVGRMIPDNNWRVIIEEYIKSETSKKLVVVGDVPFQDDFAIGLKSLCATDPRIILTGYITSGDQLAELYHHAYVYIHGHEFGGTNPTMLKALAYGSAVFALDTVFNREMLQNGKYGLFFTKDRNSLKDLIDSHDPYLIKNLKALSREGITEKYQWDYVAKRYKEVAEQLLS